MPVAGHTLSFSSFFVFFSNPPKSTKTMDDALGYVFFDFGHFFKSSEIVKNGTLEHAGCRPHTLACRFLCFLSFFQMLQNRQKRWTIALCLFRFWPFFQIFRNRKKRHTRACLLQATRYSLSFSSFIVFFSNPPYIKCYET